MSDPKRAIRYSRGDGADYIIDSDTTVGNDPYVFRSRLGYGKDVRTCNRDPSYQELPDSAWRLEVGK
jgi:hypothetical protein